MAENPTVDQHVIEIGEFGELAAGMQRKFHKFPKVLRREAGSESCCIFRVPQSLVDINCRAYFPQIVSIGPYHHGGEGFKMIEEHKWQYLHGLVRRVNLPNALEGFLEAISEMEDNIRRSYSEDFAAKLKRKALVEMMVLDGVFIIEVLSRVSKLVNPQTDDPIFNMEWVLPFLLRDLMGLENQIPFFVLEKLFELSAPSRTSDVKLNMLVLKFFNLAVQRPDKVINALPQDIRGVHLLDLFRQSFILLIKKPVVQGNPPDQTTQAVENMIANNSDSSLRAGAENENASPNNASHVASSSQVPSGDVNVSRDNLSLAGSSSQAPSGDVNVSRDNLSLAGSSSQVPSGDVNVSRDNLSLAGSSSQVPVEDVNDRMPAHPSTGGGSSLQLAQSATKIRQVGVRFKAKNSNSFLDIHYKRGAVRIPQVTIDDMARAFLLNFVAFEQCYKHCSKHMTEYSTFMGCLVLTPKDAEYLSDKQIIENYLGTHDDITNLFNNIRKDVVMDLKESYLATVYDNLNRRRRNCCWQALTELWDKYFQSPWSVCSLSAAITILALTGVQVHYAIHPASST